MEHGARNDIPATATAIEGRGRDGPGRGGAGRRALTKAVDLPETPGFEDGGAVPLRARAANVLLVKPSRHRGGAPRRHRGGIAAASRQQHSRDLCRCGGPVIQPSSGRPRAAPPAHPTGCTHLMDWSDLPEDIPVVGRRREPDAAVHHRRADRHGGARHGRRDAAHPPGLSETAAAPARPVRSPPGSRRSGRRSRPSSGRSVRRSPSPPRRPRRSHGPPHRRGRPRSGRRRIIQRTRIDPTHQTGACRRNRKVPAGGASQRGSIGWTTLPPGRRQATGRDRARLKPQRRGGDPGCFHADRPMAAPREVP